MTPVTITVLGRPAPQGSKRAFAIRKGGVPTGRVAVVESSHERVKTWRAAVLDAAGGVLETGGCTCDYPDTGAERVHRPYCGVLPPFAGPLTVSMTFWLPRPKGHYRTGRNAHLLREGAPSLPAGTPDADKLARATGDALTDAGIWRDDSQVTDYHLSKRYADGGQLPGALITIREAV